MFYEILISKNANKDKGRFSKDKNVFVIAYKKDRPKIYVDYESTFLGTDEEIMTYFKKHSSNWDVDVSDVEQSEEEPGLVNRFFKFFGM